MRYLFSILLGLALGTSAILLHGAYFPMGLLLGLLGSGIGIWLLGRSWGLRRYKILAALSWIAIIFRAGMYGAGNELLVEGNAMGNALVVGGVLTLFIAVMITF